jgi:TetR/AcrR family transcriptional regulator, regulator of cefoperazone and chloramphenicol sensitivity
MLEASAMAVVEETKERLLFAAGQVFAEKGFQNATVREICQKAEANIAAVNYHFGDKERLYIEAVKKAHNCRSEAFPLPLWAPETPPSERLRNFIENLLERMFDETSPDWFLPLLLREMAEPTTAVAELIHETIGPHFEILLAILKEVMPARTPEKRLRYIGLSIVGQCFACRTGRPIVEALLGPKLAPQMSRQLLTESIVHFSLAALGLEPPLTEGAAP